MKLVCQIFNTFLLLALVVPFFSCKRQVVNAKSIPDVEQHIGNQDPKLDSSIWVIFQDKKHNYWFGSNGRGIYLYDNKQLRRFTIADGLLSNQIRSIQEDKKGNIYIETPKGMHKYDGVKFIPLTPFRPPLQEWKLQEDDLWFKRNGESIGVYRYDGETLYQLDFSALSNQSFTRKHAVYSIYKDRQGFMWFGTESAGVCRFDGSTLQWIYEDELGKLEDGRVPAVRSIFEDIDGHFWFSNILHQYDIQKSNKGAIEYKKLAKIGSFNRFDRTHLPYFNSAIVDGQTIWMTSYNEGVWKYDGKIMKYYVITDGDIKALPITVIKDNTGEIWVGTDNCGVFRFNGKSFEKFKI